MFEFCQEINTSSAMVLMHRDEYEIAIVETDRWDSSFKFRPQFLEDATQNRYCIMDKEDFDELSNLRPDPSQSVYVEFPDKGAHARGFYEYPEKTLWICRGSVMADDDTALRNSKSDLKYHEIREELKANRIVRLVDGKWKFQRSWVFDSPSEAARVIAGYPVSGNGSWKCRNGGTLAEQGIGARR